MYKAAVLLYKAKIGDGHVVDDAINIYTALFNFPLPGKNFRRRFKEWLIPYSHIELWISDEKGEFKFSFYETVDSEPDLRKVTTYLGNCYTSTMRDGMAGTVYRPAAQVIKDPDRWDAGVIKTLTDKQYRCLMWWVNISVAGNKGYDKWCIADFFNPFRYWLPIHSKSKQICYEAFSNGMLRCGEFISKYVLSPRRAARKLRKRGVVIGPLVDM